MNKTGLILVIGSLVLVGCNRPLTKTKDTSDSGLTYFPVDSGSDEEATSSKSPVQAAPADEEESNSDIEDDAAAVSAGGDDD